jgi:hypothetical protein
MRIMLPCRLILVSNSIFEEHRTVRAMAHPLHQNPTNKEHSTVILDGSSANPSFSTVITPLEYLRESMLAKLAWQARTINYYEEYKERRYAERERKEEVNALEGAAKLPQKAEEKIQADEGQKAGEDAGLSVKKIQFVNMEADEAFVW